MEKNNKKRVCWLAAVLSAVLVVLLVLLDLSWLLAKEEGREE